LSEPLKKDFDEEHLQELETALESIAPIKIHYGPLRSFSPYPGVAYVIQPEDEIMQLRSIIHSTSLFRDTALRRAHIAPHMTIAEFITVETTDDILKELTGNVPEGTFLCGSIEYAVPNARFYFERVLTLPCGTAR
jgi:2'-5' RNA ligase